MDLLKASFHSTLEKSVLSKDTCTGCCACIVACPYDCLALVEAKPSLVEKCGECGICAKVCAQYQWSLSDMERFSFGRERKVEDVFGVHRRTVVARATDDQVLRVAQDGGVVTALLMCALDSGYVSCAVVSGVDSNKPLYPVPKIASSKVDLLACAGTRYSYSPNLLALAEAMKKKSAIAFVGTPCQISAIRRLQHAGLKKYNLVKLLLGLMCSECFDFETLIEQHLHRELKLDLQNVAKINIKGKLVVTMKDGRVTALPLAEAKQYVRRSCRFCSDFSAELADISVGGLGLDGWNLAIVRSEKGEELFSEAEKAGAIQIRDVTEESNALKLLGKLSSKRRRV
jgi:coenzyme F420 hydrogenase subunit beta